jgi:hypothetical protein
MGNMNYMKTKGFLNTSLLVTLTVFFGLLVLYFIYSKPNISNSNIKTTKTLNTAQKYNIKYDKDLIADLKRLTDKTAIASGLNTELADSTYIQIPQTALNIKIPVSYDISLNSSGSYFIKSQGLIYAKKPAPSLYQDIFDCYQPFRRSKSNLDSEYCKELLTVYSAETSEISGFFFGGGGNDFGVSAIDTTLHAKEWVLDNVGYQGIKLRDQPASISRGVEFTINGKTFFSLGVGCCGGYEQVYFYEYVSKDNIYHLLAFSSQAAFADLEDEHNIILDKIVATLTYR